MSPQHSDQNTEQMLADLGALPSTSEEHGINLLSDQDLMVFSPGISTAGFAEIRMVRGNPRRRVIATIIDKKGLEFARKVISEVGLSNRIEARYEDLKDPMQYGEATFDFIYARLVLHYLSLDDLEKVLSAFHYILRKGGRLFVVVRSVKNIPERTDITYDPVTHFTSIPHYNPKGEVTYIETRYFHTSQSITNHIKKAGF